MIENAGLLPPKLEVAIFEAMKRLPGVTVRHGATTFLGRPVIAIAGRDGGSVGGVPTNDEILLDPVTYAFEGNDSVMSADLYANDPSNKHEKAYTIKAGTADSSGVLLRSGIVDRVGEKP
jgi:hypothetical protein